MTRLSAPETAVQALAYMDGRLRERREVCHQEWQRARMSSAKWGYVAHLAGQMEAFDTARLILSDALMWIDRDRRITKDNGS